METKKRTLAKTLTFRIFATVTTMLIVYLLTKNLAVMSAVGAFEIFSKSLIYYVHERTWDNISWGIKK